MKIIKDIDQINFLDERFYTMDGENFYPSVTYILESYPKGARFNQWLKDVGENASSISERAANSDSRVHNGVNQLLKGEKLEWDDNVFNLDEWQAILKFKEFWERYNPELIASEISYASEMLGYGGTLDLVCRFNNENWLIDLKTSNALYDSYDLQKAAYRKLWNEINPNIQIDREGIFWTKSLKRGEDKKGINIQGSGWELAESKYSWQENYELFEALLKIWKRQNPNAKPKNKTLPIEIILNIKTLDI